MDIIIRDKTYKVVKDYGDTLSSLDLNEIVTDYYDNYDYIVGDWAYGKVRLKGFYKHDNKLAKKHNDYNNLESYLEKECAYGCKHFILEDISKTIEK